MRNMGSLVSLSSLLPELWSLKCQKWLIFCISCWWSKTSVTVWANYSSAPKRSYWVLSENGMVNRLWSYRSWDIKDRNIKKTAELVKNYPNPVFSRVNLAASSPEFNNPHNFLKELNKIFQMHLNIFPKLWLILCCHLQKI